MEHKNKFTGIYDMKGVPINNGDDVLVHEESSFYGGNPHKCKVIYKHGWILKGEKNGRGTCGNGYHVHPWRKSIEVVNTNNPSIFELSSYEEIKEKWFRGLSFMIVGEERKMLHKCFEEAFKLGQELKQEQNDV